MLKDIVFGPLRWIPLDQKTGNISRWRCYPGLPSATALTTTSYRPLRSPDLRALVGFRCVQAVGINLGLTDPAKVVSLLHPESKEASMDAAARVTSKGQVTLPKAVREALRHQAG